MGPFDIINDLSYSKQDTIRNSENPQLAEKIYSAFLTNRSFSYHYDSIGYSNEMNMLSGLSNICQHDYYLNGVRSKRRFAKWVKPSTLEKYEVIQQYYKVGLNKAKEIAKVLTAQDIKEIKEELVEGGR